MAPNSGAIFICDLKNDDIDLNVTAKTRIGIKVSHAHMPAKLVDKTSEFKIHSIVYEKPYYGLVEFLSHHLYVISVSNLNKVIGIIGLWWWKYLAESSSVKAA